MLEPRRGLDLAQEPFAPEHRAEIRVQHLDGDFALVAQVMRQVNRGHAARAELALDPVAAGEGLRQAQRGVRHGFWHRPGESTRRYGGISRPASGRLARAARPP
jgi:hypothetical protein